MPGSGANLKATLAVANSEGLLGDIAGVLTDPKAWCAEKGADWYSSFYDTSVGCAWAIEDKCHEVYCAPITADLTQCLPNCLPYVAKVLGTKQVIAGVKDTMSSCIDKSKPFKLKKATPVPQNINDRDGMIALFRNVVNGQRQAILIASETITLASVQAEYAVGTLIALVTARYLVPSALSLLGGLAEALLNIKAMFPGSQHGAWILILTTCEAVPLYASLLAMFQQMVGDAMLSVACVLATIYSSIGIVTGLRILSITSGDVERERLYGRIWFEYLLRVVCGLGLIGALIAWATAKHTGLREYVENELFTVEVILLMAIDILSKKVVTAVAGTDFVLHAFVSTELWYGAMPAETKDIHESEVQEMDMLLNPKANGSAPDLPPGSPKASKMVEVHGVQIGATPTWPAHTN